MCGRFSLYKISEFLTKYGVEADLKPRYNIAPTQEVPIIEDGKIAFLKWGLPFKKNVINTRVESWIEKPFFHSMKRVLIPADGFYEWKEGQPYRIETGDIFTMAGITWKGGFSIITTPPNITLKKIHDRMPAVLENEQLWLDRGELVLKEKFTLRQISVLVNSPANDTEKVLV
jgi:putative SOS response-associated peptidase YedK